MNFADRLAQAFEAGASARAHGRERASPLYGPTPEDMQLRERWYAGYDHEDAKRAAAAAVRRQNQQARSVAKARKAVRR